MAAKVAPVTDGGAACAVVDGSLAVAGTSSATAGCTSAAADAKPADTDSADGTGTASRSSAYTPSDGTQPAMPDKEQLRLEVLHAA